MYVFQVKLVWHQLSSSLVYVNLSLLLYSYYMYLYILHVPKWSTLLARILLCIGHQNFFISLCLLVHVGKQPSWQKRIASMLHWSCFIFPSVASALHAFLYMFPTSVFSYIHKNMHHSVIKG